MSVFDQIKKKKLKQKAKRKKPSKIAKLSLKHRQT
jgi:hypothetical protein